jgi:hypothetical protein
MLTPLGPARQFSDSFLESQNRFRRDPPLWFPIHSEAKAQNATAGGGSSKAGGDTTSWSSIAGLSSD